MALPKSYLTSTKNLEAILNAISSGQAPERFTQRFLESLGFASTSDRLTISLLKTLSFLDQEGKPTERYFRFLDQTQRASVLAEAIRETYADLFIIRRDAQNFTKTEVINKTKTLSQGSFSESVLEKFASTFLALCGIADFTKESTPAHNEPPAEPDHGKPPLFHPPKDQEAEPKGDKLSFGGLHYNIQIIMPATRDPKVYDALFRSLKEHLID